MSGILLAIDIWAVSSLEPITIKIGLDSLMHDTILLGICLKLNCYVLQARCLFNLIRNCNINILRAVKIFYDHYLISNKTSNHCNDTESTIGFYC